MVYGEKFYSKGKDGCVRGIFCYTRKNMDDVLQKKRAQNVTEKGVSFQP
jgi:hypothetical protein